jgi:hypothetical protein
MGDSSERPLLSSARFRYRELTDLDRVLQDTTETSVTGEGLSNLLDTGFDMD